MSDVTSWTVPHGYDDSLAVAVSVHDGLVHVDQDPDDTILMTEQQAVQLAAILYSAARAARHQLREAPRQVDETPAG